jgi:hypothetical protein
MKVDQFAAFGLVGAADAIVAGSAMVPSSVPAIAMPADSLL